MTKQPAAFQHIDEAFRHFQRGWEAADRAFEAAEAEGKALGSARVVRASTWGTRLRLAWQFQKAAWRMLWRGKVTFKS